MSEVIRNMRQLSKWIPIIVVLCLSFHNLLAEAKPQKGDLDIILSHFPGQHILSLDELDSETKAFILKHFPKDNPSVVRADFDGDGHEDFALLLKDNKSKSTKLEVLLCSGEGQCKGAYELDVTTYSDMVYLRPVRTGSRVSQTESVTTNDPSTPVKLGATGIQLTYFGKGKVVLHWNRKHKKIEEVQTED